MQIRQAGQGDASAIARVYVRSWQAAFAHVISQHYLDAMDPRREEPGWEALLGEARWPSAGVLIAEAEQGVVAFAGFRPAADTQAVAEVGTFYALPEVWGTGIGKGLMVTMLKTLEEANYAQATLWVLEANERARRFYEAAGWHADGATEKDATGGVPLAKLRYRRDLGGQS